jgi:molybdopterin-guanine dinucleotide biosynthesis protein A
MKKVNGIILAGTKRYKKFRIGKTVEHKQYLKLNNKFIIEYVIDAALQAKRIEHLYIVCDPKKIKKVLKKYKPTQRSRISIVPHKANIMDNVLSCPAAKKTVLLPSDAPFLQPGEIDEFIQTIKEGTEYAMGITDATHLDTLFDKMALYIKKERIKYGLFPIHGASVRLSNMHFIDHEKIHGPERLLGQEIYNNRKLLNEKGGKNRKSWKNIGRACFHYLHKKRYNPAIFLGLFISSIYAFFFYCAHKSRNSRSLEFYTFFLRPGMIEKGIWLLLGTTINIQIIITKKLGAMLDIDQEENYLLWEKDKSSRFKEMQDLLKEE